MLAEVEGDLDAYRRIMRNEPSVHDFTVSGDDSGYCYSHVESTEATRTMLEHRKAREFIIDMPIEFTEDGGQRVTMMGQESALLNAPDVLEQVEMELLATGKYAPDSRGVFAGPTDRQREGLETVLPMGYSENPRQATLSDIAGELDVDQGTVG